MPDDTAAPKPRFTETWCSQCGASFGPGDSGYSHCIDHQPPRAWPAELDRMERAQSGDAYAVLDRPAAPKRLTAEQIAELREMAASQFMIPVIEKPVLAALLDAYEELAQLREQEWS